MAVVPFIINETIVLDKIDYDPKSDKVLILEPDDNQIGEFQKKNSPNTSYDLRVGNMFWDVSKIKTSRLDNKGIVLRPKMFVEIETQESLHFPTKRAGRISSKVSILRKGLGVFPTNIDPGYEGNLVIYVCNFGKETIKLKRGEVFCALKMETIEGEANPYNKKSKKPEGKETQNRFRTAIYWIKYNDTVISIIFSALLVFTAILVAYTNYLLLAG